MDHVKHEHTGLDTGDTGHYECREDPIISAAAWAGEKGGVSCSTSSTVGFLLVVIISIAIVATRLRGGFK